MRSGWFVALALVCAPHAAGCRRGAGEPAEATPPAAASEKAAAGPASATAKAAASPAGGVSDKLWAHALAAGDEADEEDLAALATHEGAAGLVAAGRADPARRRLALRAAPSARGYAHVPWLAEVAQKGEEGEATLALSALADIGARVRRAEVHEDEDELAAGCATLAALARETASERARRVGATRAVRTLPCPKHELPGDLDAK